MVSGSASVRALANSSPDAAAKWLAALSEAMDIIRKDTRAAAELFMRREPSKLGLDTIHGIIGDEKMLYFTPAPTGVMAYSDHMVRAGLLKNKLANWKDAFFDNVHALPGD